MRPLPATHLLDVHGCRTGVEILSAHGAFFTPRDPSKHNSLSRGRACADRKQLAFQIVMTLCSIKF